MIEAQRLFAEKGYHGMALSELLENCKIPKGSFYYYFPDGKLQLLRETLEFSYREIEKRIREKDFLGDSAIASFERMMDDLIDNFILKGHFATLTLTIIPTESVFLDEDIHEVCRKIYLRWQRMYSDYLRKFGFTWEESQQKAQSIFGLIQGSIIASWVKRENTDLLMAKKTLKDILGDR